MIRPARRIAILALGMAVSALVSAAHAQPPDLFSSARMEMVERVERQFSRNRSRVEDPRVFRVMEQVPRHLFVPDSKLEEAYKDRPVLLGDGQTVYQPYVVALMTALLDLKSGEKVLEIGTGSGYHTAVLARLAGEVYSVEIDEDLGNQARERLAELGYDNVRIRIGDGFQGWKQQAPFDAIVLSAAPRRIPEPLIAQLKRGGKMVVPVGEYFQQLKVVTKTADGGLETKTVTGVRLPVMQGEAQEPDR